MYLFTEQLVGTKYKVGFKEGLWDLLNQKEETLISGCTDITAFTHETQIKIVKDGLTCVYTKNLKILLDFLYSSISPFGDTKFYKTQKDGKYGLLSKALIEVQPCVYESIRIFVGTNLLLFKKDGLLTVTDRLLSIKIEGIEDIKPFESAGKNLKVACIKKDGKYGFINEDFKIIVPCTYDKAYHFNKKGFCIAVLVGYHVLIDVKGNILSYVECDYMSSFSEFGFARARRGLLWGSVDVKGSTVIPFKYTSISHVDEKGNRFLNGNEQINEKDKIFGR